MAPEPDSQSNQIREASQDDAAMDQHPVQDPLHFLMIPIQMKDLSTLAIQQKACDSLQLGFAAWVSSHLHWHPIRDHVRYARLRTVASLGARVHFLHQYPFRASHQYLHLPC